MRLFKEDDMSKLVSLSWDEKRKIYKNKLKCMFMGDLLISLTSELAQIVIRKNICKIMKKKLKEKSY